MNVLLNEVRPPCKRCLPCVWNGRIEIVQSAVKLEFHNVLIYDNRGLLRYDRTVSNLPVW